MVKMNVVAITAGSRVFCLIDLVKPITATQDLNNDSMNSYYKDIYCKYWQNYPYKVIHIASKAIAPMKLIDSQRYTSGNYPISIEELIKKEYFFQIKSSFLFAVKEVFNLLLVSLNIKNSNKNPPDYHVADLSFLSKEFHSELIWRMENQVIPQLASLCLPFPSATPIEDIKLSKEYVIYQMEVELDLSYYEKCTSNPLVTPSPTAYFQDHMEL